jgi:hypothetical protein
MTATRWLLAKMSDMIERQCLHDVMGIASAFAR